MSVRSPHHLAGDLSQAYFVARCLELGWDVALPIRQHSRYDALVDRGHGFVRVQIKTGRYRDGALYFDVHSRNTKGKRRYTDSEVELFGIYSKDLRRSFLVPIEIVMSKKSMRIDEYNSNRRPVDIVWARDFEI